MPPSFPERTYSRWQALGALTLAIPILSVWAFYNGAPLLYADSIDYLLHGGEAARRLFRGEPIEWVNTRSFFYSLTILPLHAYATAWPIVFAQALLAASVLWLTLRTTLARVSAFRFLVVIALLVLASTLGWFVAYVMPDLFAPLLVLGVFQLCFAWEDLSRFERAAVALLVGFAIVAHGSHLLLAAALTPVVALLRGLRREGPRTEVGARAALRAAGRLAALLVVSGLATLLLHRALLGEASLDGRRPLFLLARTVADGPARTYLREHCHELDLAICAFADRLPDDVRGVLWGDGGVWATSSPQLRERLREEEMQVVLAAIRADPWGQLRASARNMWAQLGHFGMAGSYYPDPYIAARIHEALPCAAENQYFRSRQARFQLHEQRFARLHAVAIAVSLLVIGVCAARLRGERLRRLRELTLLVVAALLANAAVTGVLSNVEDRYQARVIWLVPLLACLTASAWLDARRGSDGPRTDPEDSES